MSSIVDSPRPWHAGTSLIETQRLDGVVIAPEHFEAINRWFNEEYIAKFMDDPEQPVNIQTLKEWYSDPENYDDVSLVFKERSTGVLVGFGSIYTWVDDTPLPGKRAEISFAVGDGSRGKGYGSEIVSGLVELAFSPLGYHRVTRLITDVVTENIPSLRAMEASGFSIIGTRKDGHFVHEHYYDLYDMSCTKYETLGVFLFNFVTEQLGKNTGDQQTKWLYQVNNEYSFNSACLEYKCCTNNLFFILSYVEIKTGSLKCLKSCFTSSL